MILRRSFLKLLALPVVAPLFVLSRKIRGHWREDFVHDVWVGSDGSETTLEELEKAGFHRPRLLYCRPEDVDVCRRIIEATR